MKNLPVRAKGRRPAIDPLEIKNEDLIFISANITYASWKPGHIANKLIDAITERLSGLQCDDLNRIVEEGPDETFAVLDVRRLGECDEGGRTDKKYVFSIIKELVNKFAITARYDISNTRYKINSTQFVISAVEDVEDTPYIRVQINKGAIPLWRYFNPARNIVIAAYSRKVADSLRGKYAGRFYKWFCDEGGKHCIVAERSALCETFGIPDSIRRPSMLTARVLAPVVRQLRSKAAMDVRYEFREDGEKIVFTVDLLAGPEANDGAWVMEWLSRHKAPARVYDDVIRLMRVPENRIAIKADMEAIERKGDVFLTDSHRINALKKTLAELSRK